MAPPWTWPPEAARQDLEGTEDPVRRRQRPLSDIAKDAIAAERLTWSATGKADNISDVAAIISHVLGLKSKVVFGYRAPATCRSR